jgi:hypothetical protein
VTIDELIAFMETRAPGFSERIQPSSGDRLEQLEQIAGRPLPPLYRAYVQRMGRSAAELAFPEDWNLDPNLVLYTIRRTVYPRERFAMCAVDQRDAWWEYHHLYFDRDDHDAVVSFEHGDTQVAHPTRIEFSFADLLIGRVARIVCLRAKPLTESFRLGIDDSSFADGMARAIAILEGAGFTPCLTPTRHSWLGHRDTTFVFVHRHQRPIAPGPGSYFVHVAGGDAASVMALLPS